jgi:hypothetical protein
MIVLMHARKVFKAGSHSGPSGGLARGGKVCIPSNISLVRQVSIGGPVLGELGDPAQPLQEVLQSDIC